MNQNKVHKDQKWGKYCDTRANKDILNYIC